MSKFGNDRVTEMHYAPFSTSIYAKQLSKMADVRQRVRFLIVN